jgi:prepilin-type N-terminal cleavage/methylation domain-containing protein
MNAVLRRTATRRASRGAFSLLELLAVVTILGVLVAAGFATMTTDAVANHSAGIAARQLALDLEQARRSAISTGDEHFLQFALSGSNITGYTLRRSTGAGSTAADSYRAIPEHVTVTMSPSGATSPAMNFEGQAASSYTMTLTGPKQSWQVVVSAATGRPRVTGPT